MTAIELTKAALARQRVSVIALVLLGLTFCAIVRSHLATRLDGYTIDEAYHITAGVAYARTGDYRLNPEHPPLVKLWVGAWFPDFQLPPFRTLRDKPDERDFTDGAVYTLNDPDQVQRRARAAMLTLHALLLLAFALAVWRVCGAALAVGSLTFLAIDPTVAAHLPVVMTDLPIALLGLTAVLLAVAAFRSWRGVDLVLASLALGLALGTKHSAIIVAASVTLLGLVLALRKKPDAPSRARRIGMLAAVLLGAVLVLWSLYGFRFNESREGIDLFNRPLAAKIDDLKSPLYRNTLHILAEGHLLPRAYLWGLADTIRAGIEGRGTPIWFYGRDYGTKTPFYFFPGVMLAKLPLGLLALIIAGAWLLLRRNVQPSGVVVWGGVFAYAALFLFTPARSNAGYAGVRHALPLFPVLALLAALTIKAALATHSRVLRSYAALAILAALVSALPTFRPWEYYNEMFGGAANAWRYFNDEGVDLGQRTKELARYYLEQIGASSEIPYDEYGVTEEEKQRRGLQLRSFKDNSGDESEIVSGTFFISTQWLSPHRLYDYEVFRVTQPTARFGNLLVYRGTFRLPWLKARNLYFRAIDLIYSDHPDLTKAEQMLREAVALYPQGYTAAIELGNLLAQRGARAEAIYAYEIAKTNASPEEISAEIASHLERIAKDSPEQVPPLRNPWLE